MMLKMFKLVAILEGVSSILLFFFAMPMKYLLNDKQYIRPFGMAHGVLFTFFILLAIFFAIKQSWHLKKSVIVFIASIVPCGTFYVDKKYLSNA